MRIDEPGVGDTLAEFDDFGERPAMLQRLLPISNVTESAFSNGHRLRLGVLVVQGVEDTGHNHIGRRRLCLAASAYEHVYEQG